MPAHPGHLFAAPVPLAWLPDETLYSLAARHHRLAGNARASETSMQLFGSPRAGAAHDLPSHVDAFARCALGELGDAASVVTERTLLPFYARLAEPALAHKAMQAMCHGSVQGLRLFLGLTTSRFPSHHPLRACAACVREDEQQFGVAYWHRAHQFPGAYRCLRHGTPLLESLLKATGVGRFQWYLPDAGTLATSTFRTPCPSWPTLAQEEVALKLARASNGLGTPGTISHLEPGALSRVYLATLRAKGLLQRNGARLRRQPAATEFLAFASMLHPYQVLFGLPESPEAAAAHLARMTKVTRQPRHPSWHLPLIAWLFDGWDEFCAMYSQASMAVGPQAPVFMSSGPRPQENPRIPHPAPGQSTAKARQRVPKADPRQLQLRELIEAGHSVTAAAHHVGIDVSTGLVWASHLGVQVKPRPKTIGPLMRALMVRMLRRGESKISVAEATGLSQTSVTRLLRTQPLLHAQWSAAVMQKREKAARKAWEAALQQAAGHMKVARAHAPAAYAWLYRNAPCALQRRRSDQRVPSRSSNSRVDWKARDKALAEAVRELAADLRQQHVDNGVTLQDIRKHLPQLRPKLNRLARLPHTAHALRDAMQRP